MAECPYCSSIPGVGQAPSHDPLSDFDVVVASTDNWVLTPTIGMLLPGYFLLISRSHVPSFAAFCKSDLASLAGSLDLLQLVLGEHFGRYTIFEHGMAARRRAHAGGCIEHAHLHLIPSYDLLDAALSAASAWQSLDDFEMLHGYEGHSYCCMLNSQRAYLLEEPDVPSQWIRRILGDRLGLKCSWDWAVYDGTEHLQVTIAVLASAAFKSSCAVQESHDREGIRWFLDRGSGVRRSCTENS